MIGPIPGPPTRAIVPAVRDSPLTPDDKLREALAALKRRSSGLRRSSLARLDPPVVSGHLVQARSDAEAVRDGRDHPERVPTRLSQSCRAEGSIERAALDAGDYFAGSGITPEPIAVTLTCTMEVTRQLLVTARTSCPDVATRIRAAIDQQTKK